MPDNPSHAVDIIRIFHRQPAAQRAFFRQKGCFFPSMYPLHPPFFRPASVFPDILLFFSSLSRPVSTRCESYSRLFSPRFDQVLLSCARFCQMPCPFVSTLPRPQFDQLVTVIPIARGYTLDSRYTRLPWVAFCLAKSEGGALGGIKSL